MVIHLAVLFIIVLYIYCSNAKKPICPDRKVPPPRMVYAIGDLHGDFDNTIAILKAANVLSISADLRKVPVKEWKSIIQWTGGQNIVVQLGDIADKGPDAPLIFRLFEILKRQAEHDGGEIHHVFGNHEGKNLCGKGADHLNLRPELEAHFSSNEKKWKKAWSKTGFIGKYVRENFEVVKVLFGRLLFVHGGLAPPYALFSPKELKAAYLHRIDSKPRCENPKQKLGGSPQTYGELRKPTNQLYDLLWGALSPTYIRVLSKNDDKVACFNVNKALKMASEWQVVKKQIRKAGVEKIKKKKRKGVIHRLLKWGDMKSLDSIFESLGSDTKEGEASLKVMIVGHTKVMKTFHGKDRRDLILRCPKEEASKKGGSGSKKSGSKESSPPPFAYLMADAGISRYEENNIKFVETKVTFHANAANCDGPFNVDLDFHQIALDPIEGQKGFSRRSRFLMSHKEN